MVRCNLAVLLAERSLKITRVSNDTGISRTTLTNLANNYGVGIQLETLNTLCMYLKVTPSQLLSFIPVNIDVEGVCWNDDNSIDIDLRIEDSSGIHTCSLGGETVPMVGDDGYHIVRIDITARLYDEKGNDDDVRQDNQIIRQSFSKLTIPFQKDLEWLIFDGVVSSMRNYHVSYLGLDSAKDDYNRRLVDELAFVFRWEDELQIKPQG